MADYYDAYERETTINMCDGEKTASIETYQKYWIHRIQKAIEKAKEQGRESDIKVIRQTENMMEVEIPRRYIKISVPRLVSEEEKQRLSERAKMYLGNRTVSESENSEDLDDEEE